MEEGKRKRGRPKQGLDYGFPAIPEFVIHPDMHIGQQFRSLRRAAGVTLALVAERMDSDIPTVCQMEMEVLCGKPHAMKTESIVRYAKAMNIDKVTLVINTETQADALSSTDTETECQDAGETHHLAT